MDSAALVNGSAKCAQPCRLAVVIINYKTPEMTLDCLNSLEGQLDLSSDVVVVVDNASGDGSPDVIQREVSARGWESWIRLVRARENGGFAAGNNLGIRAVAAEHYLLLNSDTLVQPGAVQELLAVMQHHPRIGLVSPRLQWQDGTPQISCFRYRSPLAELIASAATGPVTTVLQRYDVPLRVSSDPIEPQWTSFAAVLIRGSVFAEVGLLDDGYFMYCEDIDFCRRARRAGWRIVHWPEARVVHLRGGSSPVKGAVAARKRPPRYFYESRTRYFTKFYGRSGFWMSNLLWMAGRSISLARETLGNKQPHTCQRAALDIWTRCPRPMHEAETARQLHSHQHAPTT